MQSCLKFSKQSVRKEFLTIVTLAWGHDGGKISLYKRSWIQMQSCAKVSKQSENKYFAEVLSESLENLITFVYKYFKIKDKFHGENVGRI